MKCSNCKKKTEIENFEYESEFQLIRGGLIRLTEKFTEDLNFFGNVFQDWNCYIKKDVIDVNNVIDVNKIDNIDNIYIFDKIFSNIRKTNISGRDLELFFPLFIISDICGEEILSNTLILAQEVVKFKKESDRENNKDVKMYEFIAQSNYDGVFKNTDDVAREFSEFIGEDPKYNTSRSVGMALNRLKLVLEKRSTGRKRQVKLDVVKAQQKLLLFKDLEEVKIPFTDEELKAIKEQGLTKEDIEILIKARQNFQPIKSQEEQENGTG